MTKICGPLGWATLHSVAALYPDEPSELEKQLVAQWMEAFRRTIVCEKCHNHFTQLLKEYSVVYPAWNASRKAFTLFVLRAHNTVNKRNGKPTFTMKDSFEHLRRNVSPENVHLQRQSYILFIRRDWNRQTTLAGASAARYVKELTTVETDYWGTRDSFTWDEIETLVEGNHTDPLPSAEAPKTSLGRIAQSFSGIPRPPRRLLTSAPPQHAPPIAQPKPHSPPQTSILRSVTSSKPRFSFVSR
jgi:hypothetical protein